MTTERYRRRAQAVRTVSFGLLAGILAQYAIGMSVNLFVTIPAHHPGARPANYFSGSASSVTWAVLHGAAALAAHAALGLALVIASVAAAVLASRLGRKGITTAAALGAACVIGAGFNGASFLDFHLDVSSLIMALLAGAAIGCYATVLYALAGTRDSPGRSARIGT